MREWARAHARPLGYAAAALAAAGIGLGAYAGDLLERLELDTVDARFSVRGAEAPPDDLAVVAIDDVDFGRLEERWPFPRSFHGRMIRRLDRLGAQLVAYDVQFTEPTTQEQDNALIRATAAARPVVLATTEVNKEGESNVFGGERRLRRIGARAGNTLIPQSAGGTFRIVPYSMQGLDSFAVAAVEEASGSQVDSAEFEPGGAWIDFAGPPGTIPTYSFSKVLDGKVPPEEVEGRTVVVGVTAESEQDVHPTPVGGDELMSGPEIQANAIATVAAGLPLRSAPGGVNAGLIVLMGLLAPAAALALPSRLALAAPLAALALLLAGAQIAFDAGRIVAVVYPLLALALGVAGAVGVRHLLATVQLRRQERIIAGELPPGSAFAGHRIDELAGRGGMGVIYRATHAELGVSRALKLIAPEHAGNEEFRERFKRESRMAAMIEHTHLIPIHEVGEEEGLLYISMRFVEGEDLGELIAKGGRLDPARAARIVDQVGFALDAAHEAGLVHRDVKPANVLVESTSRGEHAYLTDFGLSKLTASETAMTATGMIVGTIDYMPPEQFANQGVGPHTDVYALGCVLYRALTGSVPFPRDNVQATMFAHMSADPPKPSESDPSIPAELDDVVAQAMAKDPGGRYGSAGELGRAALAAAEEAEVAPAPAEPVAATAEGAAETEPAPAPETIVHGSPDPPAEPTLPGER